MKLETREDYQPGLGRCLQHTITCGKRQLAFWTQWGGCPEDDTLDALRELLHGLARQADAMAGAKKEPPKAPGKCETCRWWERGDEKCGACHLYPPIPIDAGCTRAPLTTPDWWCGDY